MLLLLQSLTRKKITLGTVSMVETFLDSHDTWFFSSQSIAAILIKHHASLTYQKVESAPKRTAYVLCHKYPKSGIKETMNIFLDYVVSYIKTNKDVFPLFDR